MFSVVSLFFVFFLSGMMLSASSGVVDVFVGVVGVSAVLSFGIWGGGENLKGLVLFLVVVGSLMSVFGFLLCLIPWKIGVKSGSSWGGLAWGVGVSIAVFTGVNLVSFSSESGMGSDLGYLGSMSGGLGSEVGVVLGVLLFVVMILVVGFGGLSKGTLRRG